MALPKKFDDISKQAAGVFKDDFQCKDFSLVAKNKTNLLSASSEITVPVFPSAAAKLNFKFPKLTLGPVNLPGVAIDKFELSKDAKAVMESSVGKELHGVDGLKLEVKSNIDFTDLGELTLAYASTYTGIANTSLKIETQHADPLDFTVEAAHSVSGAVVAAQIKGLGLLFKGKTKLCPNVGVNYTAGDLFVSVVGKGQFTEFNVHALYKATAEAKVAATYQHGGKKTGDWAVGATYQVSKDLSAKAKFESSQIASVAIKKELAKGSTLFGGVSYALSGATTYGLKLQIE